MSNSGTFLAEALASTATEITEAVADAQRASEDAATQAGIATTGGATSTTQAGLATTANQQAQTALTQVQAIANGTGVVAIIDSKANVALGNGAVGPNDVAGNADGNAVNLGTGAGVGQSQTYTRKPITIGVSCGISYRGYAAVMAGAWTGARAVSDFVTLLGTHAGQDLCAPNITVPGYGTRATGSVPFSSIPAAGDTLVLNGITLTARTSPATAYEFAIGASVMATVINALSCILALPDAALLKGWYRLNSATDPTIYIAAQSRGTYGNSFTLAATGSAMAVSGATLTGGADSINSGLPQLVGGTASASGQVAIGFQAQMGMNSPSSRRATGSFTFTANPASADYLLLGYKLTKQVNFLASPSGALDVQLGASLPVTLMNATALLNASTDTTINPVTYWATTSGRLVLEHDTVNINTFWIKSMSSVATASSWRMQGGTSAAPSHNVVLGQNALSIATASGTFASAVGAGQYSNLVNSAILSPSACLNGQNVFAWGNLALAFCDGDDNIALGTGISNPALESFLPIIALTSDGTITFAAPHGWREGNFYVCSYQDSTGGSSVLQSVVAVSDAGTVGTVATIGAALVLRVVVLNAWQVKILSAPSANGGVPLYTYQVSGTVTNIAVARYRYALENSVTIGNNATAASNRITLGSAQYTAGIQIDAIGLYLSAGQLRLPSVVPGVIASGYVLFPSNFSDGDTFSVTDATGTYTLTAKATSAFATATTGQSTWFEIDSASAFKSVRNLIMALRTNDDQSTTRKIVNRARWYVTAVTGVGIRLNWQLLDTGGADWTVASTKSGATVTVTSTGTLGNLPTASSANPPVDGGQVMLTTNPVTNGLPGRATYNLSKNRWSFP
jgi:hypothetical protein